MRNAETSLVAPGFSEAPEETETLQPGFQTLPTSSALPPSSLSPPRKQKEAPELTGVVRF